MAGKSAAVWKGFDGPEQVAETLGPVGPRSGPSWEGTRAQRAQGWQQGEEPQVVSLKFEVEL